MQKVCVSKQYSSRGDQTRIAYGEDGDDSTYIIKPSAGHLLDGGDGSDLCVTNARQPINTIHCEIGNAFPDETSFITTWSMTESDKFLEIGVVPYV